MRILLNRDNPLFLSLDVRFKLLLTLLALYSVPVHLALSYFVLLLFCSPSSPSLFSYYLVPLPLYCEPESCSEYCCFVFVCVPESYTV